MPVQAINAIFALLRPAATALIRAFPKAKRYLIMKANGYRFTRVGKDSRLRI